MTHNAGSRGEAGRDYCLCFQLGVIICYAVCQCVTLSRVIALYKQYQHTSSLTRAPSLEDKQSQDRQQEGERQM